MPDPPRYYSHASSAPASNGTSCPGPADPPSEKAWRLVIGGEMPEGRRALRGGAFVELAEEA